MANMQVLFVISSSSVPKTDKGVENIGKEYKSQSKALPADIPKA
jgi:hypothetical protein